MRREDLSAYVLTLNEEENIDRCLRALDWVPRVVVVDCGSVDRTREIASSFANVTLVERAFDGHARQHAFAAGLLDDAPWVLRLDADWIVPPEVRDELLAMEPGNEVAGIRFPFRLAVQGVDVACAMYPPVVCVFRPGRANYIQDGHTERLVPAGRVIEGRNRLVHDDRKSVDRFIQSQLNYSRLEAQKIGEMTRPRSLFSRSGMKRALSRVPGLSALSMAAYLGVLRLGFFRGRHSRHYVMQRVIAELILGFRLLDEEVRRGK